MRPGVETRAAQAVAVRAGQARGRPQRADRRRSGAGPRHRPADRSGLGCAVARAARRAGRARCPTTSCDAAVKVLASWDWATRPTAVLALDSERHPLLISSLARELAELGRLTDLGTLQYAPRAAAGDGRQLGVSSCGAERFVVAAGCGRHPGGRRTGAAGRRSCRHRVDADDGGPRGARSGCIRGVAVRAGSTS